MTEIHEAKPQQIHREAMIKAGREAFARYGYERSTVREIAAAAGCAEGLVHRYFGGKHGLLEAVLAARHETAEANIINLPEAPTLEEELLQFLFWYIDSVREDKSGFVLFFSQVPFDDTLWPLYDQYFDRHMSVIATRLLPFQARGEICPITDVAVLAGILHSLSFDLGFNRQMTRQWDRDRLREFAAQYVALLLFGLQCRHTNGHADLDRLRQDLLRPATP